MHDRMESIADLHATGGLSPDERRDADQHAASCASCASLLRDAAVFNRWVTGTLAPDAPPADLEERIIGRLRASAALKTKRFLPGARLLKFVGGLAAAGAFVFIGQAFDQPRPTSLKDLDKASADFSRDYDGYLAFASKDKDKPRGWKFWSENSYERDLRQVKEYNAALDRDNAETRPKADAYERLLGDMAGKGKELDRLDDATKPTFGLETEKLAKLGVEGQDKANSPKDPGSDQQVFVRQLEVKLAEADELARKVPESRAKMPATQFSLNEPQGSTLAAAYDAKDVTSGTRPAFQDTRKIIRTADVDLEVDSYEATSTKLDELVKAQKGFVANANIQKLPNGKVRAVVTVRIPPEQFDAVIAALKGLGTVRNQNVGSQDITKQYVDLDIRRASKEALLERLKLLLKEAKGTVKELLEVEVQMGKTIEEIESIKGELKFYDNQVSLSTLTLTLSEKDLGQPFEYVQTLQSNIGLTARDADDVYAKAQKAIVDAGGQVVDSRMNRQNDGSATGTIRGRVDADKFPALREALKALGHVTNDTVNQQKTARGGAEGTPKADAPLKKEQAVVDVSITTPPLVISRRAAITVENVSVTDAYPAVRKTIESAGGKIVNGSLMGRDGAAQAAVTAQIDADKFAALVEALKASGKVKDAIVRLDLPAATPDGAPALLRERAEIELRLVSPPQLIDDDHGIGRTIRDTFAGSWKGILWSVEKLFVGLSLAGPWLILGAIGWQVWRKVRRKKAAAPN